MPDDIYNKRLLNEREAAAFLGTSAGTLNNLRARNKRDGSGPAIPYVKVGKSVRYRLSDLEMFIEANTHGAEPRAAAQ